LLGISISNEIALKQRSAGPNTFEELITVTRHSLV
jgi:hypothetical protein